jgi:uncharacterized membrane protein
MSEPTHEAAPRASHQLERLVFFSDAIFAIAITLLVLDLKLPPARNGLIVWGDISSKLFAFVLSFLVIGVYWMNHHQMFGHVRREDGRLRWVNLLFLGTIIFLPFPTSVIAEFPATTASTQLYTASAAATGVMFALLALVVRRGHLMDPAEISGRSLKAFASTLGAPSIFILATGVAAVDPQWALRMLWLIAPATWIAHWAGRWLERRWIAKHNPAISEM